jgi:simple sugar transport system substrate-binding protein
VYALPYDYKLACQAAPDVCLGVPYFNWGPPLAAIVKAVSEGTYKPGFEWLAPDFAALNDPDKSPIGFAEGDALSPEAKKALARFIADLGTGTVNLYAGPLQYQDGAAFVQAGSVATDKDIWFCPQLLRGMEGASASK